MPVRTYSTGMMMRLAFSISTSVEADILLMDEWLSMSYTAFTGRAAQRMREVVSKQGILVLASHLRVDQQGMQPGDPFGAWPIVER